MSRISLTNMSTPDELLEHVQAGKQVDVVQWSIGVMNDRIWATNPYGIDVACVDVSTAGCASILQSIANDTHEREWA